MALALPRDWYRYYDTAAIGFGAHQLMPSYTPRHDVGWRFWERRSGKLVSPFVALATNNLPTYVLPPNGLAVAVCDQEHQPPAFDHDCGLHYWPRLVDIYRAIRIFRLARCARRVVTFGKAFGPYLPDESFTLDGQHLFRGLRATAYQVLCAIAVPHAVIDPSYDFPMLVYTDTFPDLHEIEKEYAA